MPNRLPWSTHPHRQRQKRQYRHPIRIPRHNRLVHPYPRI